MFFLQKKKILTTAEPVAAEPAPAVTRPMRREPVKSFKERRKARKEESRKKKGDGPSYAIDLFIINPQITIYSVLRITFLAEKNEFKKS